METETVINAIISEEDNSNIKLSTGVVLHRKPFSFMYITKIAAMYGPPDPKDYRIWDAENNRWLDNPDNPAYTAEVQRRMELQGLAILDAVIALGTEIAFIPDSVQKPEDTHWVEDCRFFNITVATEPFARYLDWVKYVAISTLEDMQKISALPGMAVGNSEENVAKAMNSFRNNPVGPSNSVVAVKQNS